MVERSGLATGPALAAAPTSQPLAPRGTAVTVRSQKKSCAYWTVTVFPSVQAGVRAEAMGTVLEPGARAEPPTNQPEKAALQPPMASATLAGRAWGRPMHFNFY